MARKIKLRPAREEDLQAIIELKLKLVCDYPDSFFDTFEELEERSLAAWQEWLEKMLSERSCLFLAQNDSGNLVGIVGCSGSRHLKAFHSATIEGLGVLSEFTNQGIGTKLMMAVIDWAKTIPGLVKLRLGVYANHPKVVAFYRRLGFKEEGILKKAIWTPPSQFQDLVSMALFLEK